MTCSKVLALALVIVAGCTEDVPTLELTATATNAVELAPPDDGIPADFGRYRWELLDAPADAHMTQPVDITASITIQPMARGIYTYNRWFVGPAAEQLSAHVIVTVNGKPPTAVIAGDTLVSVGTAAMFDGTPSGSAELRPLMFEWRLAVRAESSTAELANIDGTATTLVPDVKGTYSVELRVFDGELWSGAASVTLTAR